MINVEICCNSTASAMAAKEGGANRIELCRDLECGGLTPSDEDIRFCVQNLGLRTHVLVRPRSGNFYYNADEMGEIIATIERCRKFGAAAVVVGFLDYDACIDAKLTRWAVEAAGPMEVTFHRAFDEARQDPLEALEIIASCGCNRLLTSGQHPTIVEGAEVIKRLVDASSRLCFQGRQFTILAGGGVTPSNARELIMHTNATELHGSCKTTLPSGIIQTDPTQVRALLQSVSGL